VLTHLVTPEPASSLDEAVPEVEEFELVLGRRQVASVTFVILVLLAVFSGVSFVAGKAAPVRKVETPTAVAAPVPEPTPIIPILEATVAPSASVETTLFSNPVPKAIYIQMGAVEKGIAVIFAEGLRKHGLNAFVAPGPNDKIYRVLVGPFPSAEAFQSAKAALDQIGLNTFARRYEEQ
jgi:cell division septation protein DedD